MPFISADVIEPGFKGISIENKITNIQDFPDYVFVSAGNNGIMPSQCPVYKIDSDGILRGQYYKLCSIAVYAIKKSDFDEKSLIKNNTYSMNESDRAVYDNYLKDFFSSSKAKEVISGIFTSTTVPELSTQEKIYKEYSVSLTENASKTDKITTPSNTKVQRNNLIYIYIIAPIIALAIILCFVFRRKRFSEKQNESI